MKFKSTKDEQAAQQILQEGKKTKFWQLIVQVMEESKADLQRKQDSEDMQDLPPEKYKLISELFKAKKDLIDKLINTPDSIVSYLDIPRASRKEYDPYSQPEEEE